jgi:hypothetical protein
MQEIQEVPLPVVTFDYSVILTLYIIVVHLLCDT